MMGCNDRYIQLAELLEEAAKALREAGKCLEGLPTFRGNDLFSNLPGYSRLSVRLRKALQCERYGQKPLLTVADVTGLSSDQLLERAGLGHTSLQELQEFLGENNL